MRKNCTGLPRDVSLRTFRVIYTRTSYGQKNLIFFVDDHLHNLNLNFYVYTTLF